jgi:hypothetical protein
MTYMRGAFIEFVDTGLIPIPNVIVFQFNPETMTHTWSQAESAGNTGNPLAVKGAPGEQFSFTLAVDALDAVADGGASGGLAEISGVASRLAAMEMLLFPSGSTKGGLIGTVTAAIGGLLGGGGSGEPPRDVPASVIPTVLFVWGPGRIVPVRLTTLTVTEKLYDTLLIPTHAEAQIGLRVLTTEDLKADNDLLAPLAKAAISYSNGLREVLAIANLVNAADGIVGMIPH